MKPYRYLMLLAPITWLAACSGKTATGNISVGGSFSTAIGESTGGRSVSAGGIATSGGAQATGGRASTAGSSSTGGTANTFGFGGSGNGGTVSFAGNGSTGLTGGKVVANQGILDQVDNVSCASAAAELEVSPALLEFVIDISGSMNDIPTGAVQSKWEKTKAVLADVISNGLPDVTGIGMLLFPNMNTVPNNNDKLVPIPQLPVETCVNVSAMVPVAPLGAAGSAQRSAVAQALAGAQVAGGTPMDDAFEYAFNMALLPGKAKYSYYTPFMVVITDGQPTISLGCAGPGSMSNPVDWHPIVNFIQQIYASTPTTKTFIVGSPGSEAQSFTGADGRPWLSMAARFGGTQSTPNCTDSGPNYCHFDMSQSSDFSGDLTQALKDIIKSAVSCSVKMPVLAGGPIPDSTKINVIYEANVQAGTPSSQWLVGQTTDTTCGGGVAEGWYIDPNDPTGTSIVLCPTTCKTVQGDKYAVISVRLGCQTIALPPM